MTSHPFFLSLLVNKVKMDFFNLSPEEKINQYLDYNGGGEGFLKFESNDPVKTDNTPLSYIGKSSTNPLLKFPKAEVKVDNTEVVANSTPFSSLAEYSVDLEKPHTIPKIKRMENLTAGQQKVVQSIEDTTYDADTKKYLVKLAYLESRYRPEITNEYGYAGLYQFGKDALDWVGITKDEYMSDVNVQHKAAAALGELNFKQLKKFVGKEKDGITLTKANLMGAAHLLGAGDVKNWILDKPAATKRGFKDANGTTIQMYLKKFS